MKNNKIIIIKYGELTTKKDNINFFLNALRDNLKSAFKDIPVNIIYDSGRMYVETDEFDKVVEILSNTFGIHEINIADVIDNDNFDAIASRLLELLKTHEFSTFKVITKRSDKKYPLTSLEVSAELGGVVLKNIKDKKVDIHNPDININIEIRRGKSYIYFEKIKGIGGYPVGTLGKGLLMLSGGIDSPVAGYMALKRGIRIEAVYFESPPHSSEAAKNKVLELARILSKYSGYLKVHVINFTEIQESIYKNCPKEYLITLMRRMMYRISERIAYRNNVKVIINGESIGQVASQTLTSMNTINTVVDIPVIRPVACFDKLEIIDLAKKIKTYETSILPFEDCCTIFVPEHPVINPDKRLAAEYEKLIPYEEMISKAIKTKEIVKIEPKMKDFDNIL